MDKGTRDERDEKFKNSKDGNRKDEENPEYENFQQILERALSVPKRELDKRRAEYERKKKKRTG